MPTALNSSRVARSALIACCAIALATLVGASMAGTFAVGLDLTQGGFLALFLAVVAACTAVGWRMHRDFLSPVVLMSLGWVVPITLHTLHLSPTYLVSLRASTWLTITGTLVLFNLGSLLTAGSSSLHPPVTPRRQNRSVVRGDSGEPWSRRVLYGYCALGLLAWLYGVWQKGGREGLAALSDRPEELRWVEPPKIVGQIPVLLSVAMLICLVRWERAGLKREKHVVLLFLVGLCTLMLDTARSNLYHMSMTGVIFWVLMRRTIPKKWLAGIMAACLFFFVAVAKQRTDSAPLAARALTDFADLPEALVLPYVYLTSSITNLELNLEGGRQLLEGGGVRTFAPILSWLQIYKTPQFERYLTYWGGGISVYQADLYIDFGLAGLIFGPLVLGALCGLLYRRWRVRGSSFHAMMYAVVATAVVTSALVNWFSTPPMWFFFFLLPPALWRSRAPATERGSPASTGILMSASPRKCG